MAERTFKLNEATFISCTEPCGEFSTLLVEGNKIKELKGKTSTLRCIASGAAQRGQKFGLREGHAQKPEANRICTIYTQQVDNA